MKKVWIIETGEDYEGGSILGVFSSHETAITMIEGIVKDGWKQASEGENRWEKGCDWLSITEVSR